MPFTCYIFESLSSTLNKSSVDPNTAHSASGVTQNESQYNSKHCRGFKTLKFHKCHMVCQKQGSCGSKEPVCFWPHFQLAHVIWMKTSGSQAFEFLHLVAQSFPLSQFCLHSDQISVCRLCRQDRPACQWEEMQDTCEGPLRWARWGSHRYRCKPLMVSVGYFWIEAS